MAAFPFLQPFPKKTTDHQINNLPHLALLQITLNRCRTRFSTPASGCTSHPPSLPGKPRGKGIGYYAGAITPNDSFMLPVPSISLPAGQYYTDELSNSRTYAAPTRTAARRAPTNAPTIAAMRESTIAPSVVQVAADAYGCALAAALSARLAA